MIIATLIILVIALFVLQKWLNKNASLYSEKVFKTQIWVTRFLMIVPLLGCILFSILFLTVLKGLVIERCTHALIVLMLWLVATSFYADLVFYWQNKRNRIVCILGFIIAAGIAVFLTPLERYISSLYELLHMNVFIIIIAMLLVYYWGIYLLRTLKK